MLEAEVLTRVAQCDAIGRASSTRAESSDLSIESARPQVNSQGQNFRELGRSTFGLESLCGSRKHRGTFKLGKKVSRIRQPVQVRAGLPACWRRPPSCPGLSRRLL